MVLTQGSRLHYMFSRQLIFYEWWQVELGLVTIWRQASALIVTSPFETVVLVSIGVLIYSDGTSPFVHNMHETYWWTGAKTSGWDKEFLLLAAVVIGKLVDDLWYNSQSIFWIIIAFAGSHNAWSQHRHQNTVMLGKGYFILYMKALKNKQYTLQTIQDINIKIHYIQVHIISRCNAYVCAVHPFIIHIPFIYPSIHLFTHSFIQSHIHSLIHSFTHHSSIHIHPNITK